MAGDRREKSEPAAALHEGCLVPVARTEAASQTVSITKPNSHEALVLLCPSLPFYSREDGHVDQEQTARLADNGNTKSDRSTGPLRLAACGQPFVATQHDLSIFLLDR